MRSFAEPDMDADEFDAQRQGIAGAYGQHTDPETHAPAGAGAGIGALIGAGIGALAAIPTGGLSVPAGAALGSTLGSAGGGLAQDAIEGNPNVGRDIGGVAGAAAQLAKKRAEAEATSVGTAV